SPAARFANVAPVAPTIGLVVPIPVYHCIVKSVAAGAPPSTSMVIVPFDGAPVQFVLFVIVFCVITGLTLTSFNVKIATVELHSEVVFVATTLYEAGPVNATPTVAPVPEPAIGAPKSSNHAKVKPVVPPLLTPSINTSVICAEPFATQSV